MLRWVAKLTCGLIMTVAMPICFLLPVKMADVFNRWGSRGQYMLDLLTCFAGGVFLASYLVFMAPAVRVLIEDNLMTIYNIEYPLPDTIIGLGFFMMLLLDKLVKTMSTECKKGHTRDEEEEANHVTESIHVTIVSQSEAYETESKHMKQNPNSSAQLLRHPSQEQKCDIEKTLNRCDSSDHEGIGLTLSPNHMALGPRDSSSEESDDDVVGVTLSPNHMAAKRRSRIDSERSRKESECSDRHQVSALSRRESIVEAAADSTRSVSRSLVMMLALSIDSVLEGMTIGLKKNVMEVWAIFIGIIIHESVIAFCLGLQLVRVHTSVKPVVLASIVYTIMNPLGVLVATVVYETSDTDRRIELANGILQALTAGCFIYIVFYEILEGQIDQDTPLAKILATFLGYIVLASFAALPGSSAYAHGKSSDSTGSSSSNGSSYSSSTYSSTRD